MKKKRENLSALEHAKLKIPSDFQSGNAKIHTLIEELRNTDSFELQQQIISEVSFTSSTKIELNRYKLFYLPASQILKKR